MQARTAKRRQRVIASIETNAAAWAAAIASGELAQPGYRAQRDAYCASRR